MDSGDSDNAGVEVEMNGEGPTNRTDTMTAMVLAVDQLRSLGLDPVHDWDSLFRVGLRVRELTTICEPREMSTAFPEYVVLSVDLESGTMTVAPADKIKVLKCHRAVPVQFPTFA